MYVTYDRPATSYVKVLYWSALGTMLLVLCGIVGFIIGRGTAPIPHYGNNSLVTATGQWDFPGTLDGCEKLATVALAQAHLPFVAETANRSLSRDQTQSIQLYTSRYAVETPNGRLPIASAMVICDSTRKQMRVIVADHGYHHHDMIKNFQQSLDQESRPN